MHACCRPLQGLGLLVGVLLLTSCAPVDDRPPPLLPGLAEGLGRLDVLTLEQAEGTLVFERSGALWHEADEGWRIDRRLLRPLLSGLAEARCDESRTADPERFARIGVQWPPESEASDTAAFARPTARVGLRLGEAMQQVVIGFPRANGGTFVRVEGAASSCLTRVDLRVPARLSEWRDPKLWAETPPAPAQVSIEDAGRAVPVVLVVGEGGYRREGEALALSPVPGALVGAVREARITTSRPLGDATPIAERVIRFLAADESPLALGLRRDEAGTWARVLEAPAAQGDDLAGREFLLSPEGSAALWAFHGE